MLTWSLGKKNKEDGRKSEPRFHNQTHKGHSPSGRREGCCRDLGASGAMSLWSPTMTLEPHLLHSLADNTKGSSSPSESLFFLRSLSPQEGQTHFSCRILFLRELRTKRWSPAR